MDGTHFGREVRTVEDVQWLQDDLISICTWLAPTTRLSTSSFEVNHYESDAQLKNNTLYELACGDTTDEKERMKDF